MTEKELSQLYWLNKETEKLQEELKNKCSCDLYRSPIITGLPKGNAHIDKLAEHAAETDEIRQLIELNLKKIQIERARLERYIAGIEDSSIRLIFRLRHINGMTWEQIGADLNYTKQGVYAKYKRYMQSVDKIDKQL